ncbi:MAG: hypothetical protein ACTSQY_11335, partial [Candidatus Odinarchaeia archaeon]
MNIHRVYRYFDEYVFEGNIHVPYYGIYTRLNKYALKLIYGIGREVRLFTEHDLPEFNIPNINNTELINILYDNIYYIKYDGNLLIYFRTMGKFLAYRCSIEDLLQIPHILKIGKDVTLQINQ